MKSKARPLDPFPANPLKSIPANTSSKNDERSPYLKAVLSGALRATGTGDQLTSDSSDKDAALRYIRESRLLMKK